MLPLILSNGSPFLDTFMRHIRAQGSKPLLRAEASVCCGLLLLISGRTGLFAPDQR